MTGAWHGGKGPNRRREDTAKVEANWPSEWNAREKEQVRDALITMTYLAHGLVPAGVNLPDLLGREHG
jgi:hypothetical protein